MKSKSIIIFTTAILLLVAGIFFLSGDILTPYVKFSDAEKIKKTVQIIGTFEKAEKTEQSDSGFSFTLKESTGAKMRIISMGTKPVNFEHAEQIVVLGKFDNEKKIMIAEKVLTKCPSKYEKQVTQK